MDTKELAANLLVSTTIIACGVVGQDPNNILDVIPIGLCCDGQAFTFIVRMTPELDCDLQITLFKLVQGMEIQRLKAGEDARPPNSTPGQMAQIEKEANEEWCREAIILN